MTRKWFSFALLITLVASLIAGCAQPVPIAPPAESGAAAGGGEQAASGAAPAGEAVQGGVWTRAS
ncbi:MAG: hypothetical protein KDD75_11295, partial [Caldilineaceae bacterium]|nr:hypothetical protein [Caldilineaceae bacterium]